MGACRHCGKTGHLNKNCPDNASKAAAAGQAKFAGRVATATDEDVALALFGSGSQGVSLASLTSADALLEELTKSTESGTSIAPTPGRAHMQNRYPGDELQEDSDADSDDDSPRRWTTVPSRRRRRRQVSSPTTHNPQPTIQIPTHHIPTTTYHHLQTANREPQTSKYGPKNTNR